VRGRGAICRDLGLDLARIHSIGVRAVVCCLNDEELEYLGAPWAEYEREADRLGLDVFRLPMAEGFAPTKVAEMDAAMTAIVTDCTLRGTNVLVHCRGGVGRAGLIACAWLLKMGFVADKPQRPKKKAEEAQKFLPHAHELDDKPRKARASEVDDADDDAETILETVRSLIETIRRRRSPKAIETAEQVRFLVDYLTYLHRQERLRAQAGR
jgi:protein-tyrosine phosphatase